MNPTVLTFILVLVLTGANAGFAQRPLGHDSLVVPQDRIDARDLGYPPLDVIPNGESGITALTVAPNGDVYGATSGKRSHLFVFDPRHGFVQPLGVLPDTAKVGHAVVASSDGAVYIGSGSTGRLLKYSPSNPYETLIHAGDDKPAPVEDLGQAVPGEQIFALAIDRDSGVLYGLASPGAHFFSFSLSAGTFSDFGVVATSAPQGEAFETEKMMSRMLVLDTHGNVYASGENGGLFKFDRKSQALAMLPLQIPAIPGGEPRVRVDAFMLDEISGLIYGGTSDGYLFRFDPGAETMENLGKPLLQSRIAGLVPGPGDRIYGVGGTPDGMARMFSCDPARGTYEVLGFVDVNRRPHYISQAHVIGAMVAGRYGTIYIGQNERISRLYLFYPW